MQFYRPASLAERAVAHVAAYCVANDVTARGYHRREVVPVPV